jgi:stress-induced-phosphoprotein 1
MMLAIESDPTNHVLFSNRSASLASLGRYEEALTDAEKVVSIKPDWVRGYSRQGAALHGLGKMEDAARAYQGGLKIDPSNAQLKAALQEVLQSMSGGVDPMAMLSSLFNADIYDDIAAIPSLNEHLSDPTYKKMIDDIVANPSNLQNYFSDPRLEETIKQVLGRKMGPLGAGAQGGPGMEEERPKGPEAETKRQEEEPVPTPTRKEVSEEERKEMERKEKVESLKKEASKFYFGKNFVEALKAFEECLELDPENVAILNNKSAVLIELGQFDEAVKVATETVELARKIHADFKLIARALERMGNALLRQDKPEEALECFRKSVTEFRNPEVLKKIKNVEADLKKKAEMDYVDVEIALEEKEKGNVVWIPFVPIHLGRFEKETLHSHL